MHKGILQDALDEAVKADREGFQAAGFQDTMEVAETDGGLIEDARRLCR